MTTLYRIRELVRQARETAQLATDFKVRALLLEIADILEKFADELEGRPDGRT